MPFRGTHIKVHPERYIPPLTQPIRNAAPVPFHEVGCNVLISRWVVQDSCLLGWSALVVLCDGGCQIWFWLSGRTMVWFGSSADLVWGRIWWTAVVVWFRDLIQWCLSEVTGLVYSHEFARDKFRSYERFVNQDLIANGRLVFIGVIKSKSGQI